MRGVFNLDKPIGEIRFIPPPSMDKLGKQMAFKYWFNLPIEQPKCLIKEIYDKIMNGADDELKEIVKSRIKFKKVI